MSTTVAALPQRKIICVDMDEVIADALGEHAAMQASR